MTNAPKEALMQPTVTDPHDTTLDHLAGEQALDSLRAATRHLERAAVCLTFAADRIDRIAGTCGAFSGAISEPFMLGALAGMLAPVREQVQVSMDRLEEAGAR